MEAKDSSPVNFAIVGSSNFTRPGLMENPELNLFSTDQAHIDALRNWYNELWKESDEVTSELLKAIEPHLKAYDPFTVYAKVLFEFTAEVCAGGWNQISKLRHDSDLCYLYNGKQKNRGRLFQNENYR